MTRRDPRYRAAFADGLRQAAAILSDLEAEVERRLARGAVCKLTQAQRRVRLQAFKVGRTRVTTALRAIERRPRRIEDKLEDAGL